MVLLKRCSRFVCGIVAAIIIFFALLLNIARLTAPLLDKHKHRFEQVASEILHRPVTIGTVQVTWYDFQPAVALSDVRVLTPSGQHQLLKLRHFIIALDLFSSLWHWQWLPGHLAIDGVSLTLKQSADGHVRLSGVDMASATRSHVAHNEIDSVMLWLLTQAQVTLKNVNVLWLGPNHFTVPLNDLSVTINNSEQSHHLLGQFVLKQSVPTQARFVINFNAKNPLSRAFSAKVFFQAHHIALAQWANESHLVPLMHGFTLQSGVADMAVWASWQQGHLKQLHSVFDLSHASVHSPWLRHTVMLQHLGANLLYQSLAHGWRISADKFQMRVNGDQWPMNQWVFEKITANALTTYTANLQQLHWQNIHTLLSSSNLLSKKLYTQLKALKPHGYFRNTAVCYVNQPNKSWYQNLSVSTVLRQGGFDDVKHNMSMHQLNANIVFHDGNGSIDFVPSALSLNMPDWFYRPFHWRQFSGGVSWHYAPGNWQVALKKINVNDGNMHMRIDGRFYQTAHQPVMVDWHSSFNLARASGIQAYLPLQHLSPAAYDWLSSAFLTGSAHDGVFTWVGALDNFPYNTKPGDFDIRAQVHNVTLHYRDHWPNIVGLSGLLEFHDQGMQVRVPHGWVDKVSLTDIKASIADLRHSGLDVSGKLNGDLSHAENFLRQTPLDVAKQFALIRLTGPVAGNLAIHIPIHHHGQETVDGLLTIQHSKLALPNWRLSLDNLIGQIHFTQDSIQANAIRGSLFNQPLTVNVSSTPNKKNQQVDVHLQSTLPVAALKKQFGLARAIDYMQGRFPFQADVILHAYGAHESNQFRLQSQLNGLAIHLPAPLGKTAKTFAPLTLVFDVNLDRPIHLQASYDRILSANMWLQQQKKHWQIQRGQILLGRGEATLPKPKGLLLSVNLPGLNVASWQQFLRGRQQNTLFMPRLLDMRLASVTMMNQIWHHLHVQIQPRQKDYVIALSSQEANGQLQIPKDMQKGTVYADMQSFHYQPLSHNNTSLSPTSIPNLDVHIDQMTYKNNQLGTVLLQANRIKHGLDIRHLQIQLPTASWQGQVLWTQTINKKQYTSIRGKLTGDDFGKALKQWQLTDVIAGGAGRLQMQLSAALAFPDFSLAKASGSLGFNVQRGRILKLTSSAQQDLGLGRMLNLLSLQSLPQRLMFNFGDLTAKGFAFDGIEANLQLQRGVATIQRAQVIGHVADVNAKGSIDLANKTYNVVMAIKPKVTGSLPLIATLAGGPLAGAITWLVNTVVVNPAVSNAAMVKYQITGPWKHPKVEKL